MSGKSIHSLTSAAAVPAYVLAAAAAAAASSGLTLSDTIFFQEVPVL